MRALLVLVSLSSCAFEGSPGTGDGMNPGQLPDAPPPCTNVTGFISFCAHEPTKNLILAANENREINTGSSEDCIVHTQSDGSAVCLMHFTDVDIPASAKLFAYGARPLALIAKGSIKINGTLDVSSRLNRPARPGAGALASCTFGAAPATSTSGGGGGAGGSMATQGGSGGTGDTDGINAAGGTPNATLQSLTLLRGGCDGQSGATGPGAGGVGGRGGGAIYLSAPSVEANGVILAGGAGATASSAVRGGGAGGGSGGAILIQSSAYTIGASTMMLATGGGGSSGGTGSDAGEGGSDATMLTPADGGGSSGSGTGGGGVGATNTDPNINGEAGFTNQGGGGGGGGGGGFIILLGSGSNTSTSIMPPPTVTPQ